MNWVVAEMDIVIHDQIRDSFTLKLECIQTW